jgi:hypothetical protein
LESKLKDERALNKNLQEENKKLKDTTLQLEQEKTLIKNSQEENKKLKDTIDQLEQEKKTLIKNSQEENKKLKETIYQLEQEKKTLIKNIKEEEKTMSAKNEKIYDIEKSIKTKSITELKEGEVIISVLFLSMGRQDIQNYSLPCKNTDLFVDLERQLYEDYPEYKNYETYFEVNTRRILRFKTIEENNIRSNAIINIFTVDI